EEDEAQQQRLDDRARDELAQALAQDDQVAQEERPEGDPARRHRRAGGEEVGPGGRRRCHQSRNSLPVRLMKTFSSDGGATCTSRTVWPARSTAPITRSRTRS